MWRLKSDNMKRVIILVVLSIVLLVLAGCEMFDPFMHHGREPQHRDHRGGQQPHRETERRH
jgi:hypothetical protein